MLREELINDPPVPFTIRFLNVYPYWQKLGITTKAFYIVTENYLSLKGLKYFKIDGIENYKFQVQIEDYEVHKAFPIDGMITKQAFLRDFRRVKNYRDIYMSPFAPLSADTQIKK